MRLIKNLVVVMIALSFSANTAWACADGPDHYRVTGVASDDMLNVRSGPGLGFSVIGKLPHNAKKVENRGRVPVHLCDGGVKLNNFEKRNIWISIVWQERGNYVYGWVKAKFLRE